MVDTCLKSISSKNELVQMNQLPNFMNLDSIYCISGRENHSGVHCTDHEKI